MEPQARVFVILLSFLVVLVVVRQLRRWNLGLEVSILWLSVAFGGLLLAVAQKLADRVSHWIGIQYPPALFFLISLVGGLFILLRMSSTMAKLEHQNQKLAQEIAILKHEVESSGRQPGGKVD
ncbi:MAG: DUF2304 domain-containing protein [Candidatus Eisenbacteria bacterium]|uniref:DUF2304 domain-containing protein n=1 Tax=Eiseniibacteriota bacterium TaxID=2212470 RepID=A0A948RUV4_UNCEI|nr:DUF2304 domain-containing protein [Candidatus Eisenbacteria bacterium]MBU1948264.1 DUF2304 domain-containing protein [Candidatus Eisenbacteria bacterium]MBU2691428.1 DUF2304 domain-containing protein [Candidatus Eisenbacteria bacterium]